MSATIIHYPRRFMTAHPFPGPKDTGMTDVRDMVNHIAMKRFGCTYGCLKPEERDILMEGIATMLCKLDALGGRAS